MTSKVLCNTFFEIQDGGQVLCTVSKLKAFSSGCAFQNVGNRTKTDLVTLILLNGRDLSKIITFNLRANVRFEH